MQCDKCNGVFEVNSENSQVWVFLEEPAFSHLRITCTCVVTNEEGVGEPCGYLVLVMLSPEGLEECHTKHKVPKFTERTPEEWVKNIIKPKEITVGKDKDDQPTEEFNPVLYTELEELEPDGLRDRMLKTVAAMAWELETVTVQDIVNALPFQSLRMPLKWR